MTDAAASPPVRAARLLWPRSLQHRAPARFEIVDARGHPAKLTVVGYRLRPGTEYRLRVELQERTPHGWRLQVAPPPWFVEWPAADSIDGGARTLTFATRSTLQAGWLQYFRNPATRLHPTILFDDGRQSFGFDVPVVLIRRWLYAPIVLVGLAPGFVSTAWSWPVRTAVIAGTLAAFLGLCFCIDVFRTWKHARRRKAKLDRSLPQVASDAGRLE